MDILRFSNSFNEWHSLIFFIIIIRRRRRKRQRRKKEFENKIAEVYENWSDIAQVRFTWWKITVHKSLKIKSKVNNGYSNKGNLAYVYSTIFQFNIHVLRIQTNDVLIRHACSIIAGPAWNLSTCLPVCLSYCLPTWVMGRSVLPSLPPFIYLPIYLS